MAANFTFKLKPEKQTSFYRIELLVVLLHLLTFIILAITRFPNGIGMLAAGIVVAIIYLLLFFTNKNHAFRNTVIELPVYLFVLWWLYAGVYWMAALVLLFSIFATLAKQKIQVIFSPEAILYKSFPRKTINWFDLNNVVLRDGLLTIDFKNDKLIQQLVEEDAADEQAFNTYCQTQLKTAAAQPQTSTNS